MLRTLIDRLARLRRGPNSGGSTPGSSPVAADRLIALGNQLEVAGRPAEACAHYRAAVSAAPRYAKAHLNLGIGLSESGDLEGAAAAFRTALAIEPGDPYANYNLGRLLMTGGAPQDAERHLRAALESRPEFPEALAVLAAVLEAKGAPAEAAAALELALVHRPEDFGALYRYGTLLIGSGRLVEAEDALRRACASDPASVDANLRLATLLKGRNALPEAERCLRRVLELSPEHDEARSTLFHVLQTQGNLPAALVEIETLARRLPERADVHYNRGLLLKNLRCLAEAQTAFETVIAIEPGFGQAYKMLASVQLSQMRTGDALATYASARARLPADLDLQSAELFAHNFSEEISEEYLFEKHREFGVRIEAAYPPHRAPYANVPDPARRLRVGFVSGDFCFHVVALFMLPLLERHDRSAVEIYCYSVGDRFDDYSRQLAARADFWRNADALSEAELAALIERDRIDLLVDLAGHSGLAQLGLFARRPAPVQAAWLGYLNTTGMTRIQFRITDRHSDPPGVADSLHTERLLRLPDSQWCYRPFIATAPLETRAAERNGFVTFGSFAQPAKLSPAVRRQWAEILRQLPDSRLLVAGVSEGDAQEMLLRDFAGAGIPSARVSILPYRALTEYFSTFNDVDLALDTFPYSGGTTTCDTLWMGVPVVTLPGARSASRSAASVLRTLGLDDWIAASAEDYVRLAVERARDRDALARLRRTLRSRMLASPLMDELRFARAMENAYREMWGAWCATEEARRAAGAEGRAPEAARQDAAEEHAVRYEELEREGRPAEAMQELEAALAQRPDWPDARYNYGVCLLAADRFDDAEAAFRKVLALDPHYALAYRMLGNLLHRQGRIGELLELCRAGRERMPQRFDLESFELLALNFSDNVAAPELFARHRAFGERLERAAEPLATLPIRRVAGRRLRIGYVSGEFSRHPVSLFLLPLLEKRDRENFEVWCYSSGQTEDEFTREVRRHADAWRAVGSLSDRELAQSMLNDALDIAVDLSGHSGITRLGAFAHQPAPVQIAWLGYLNTTGLSRIQYRITDGYCDPPGVSDSLHTEQLLRLPNSQWCYRPFAAAEAAPAPPCERNGFVTFGSFNQPAKLSPAVRDTWAAILAGLPDARLLVFGIPSGRATDAFIRDCASRGIEIARVTVRPHLPLDEYYRSFANIDLALDAFPYSGGTTTCDTLWMGVPVVTLPGARPASRSAASVLRTLGLDDWIAASAEDYVRLAVERARDRDGLARLRRTLRSRMLASPLMDEPRFARDFEQLLRDVWRVWCEKSAR